MRLFKPLSLIIRTYALTTHCSANPDKRDKYDHEIVFEKPSETISNVLISRKLIFNSLMTLLLCLALSYSPAFAAPPDAPAPSAKDKCPVCGMFVSKYPDWVTTVTFKYSSVIYFDGVKDFFTYYYNMQKYTPEKIQAGISSIIVKDYYTLKPVDARKASFVIGSDVYGPMGKELVPFEKLADAYAFLKDHKGKMVLRFSDVTPRVLKSLE